MDSFMPTASSPVSVEQMYVVALARRLPPSKTAATVTRPRSFRSEERKTFLRLNRDSLEVAGGMIALMGARREQNGLATCGSSRNWLLADWQRQEPRARQRALAGLMPRFAVVTCSMVIP